MLQKSRTGCQVMPVWSLITAIISIAKITMITLITSILLVSLFATLFAALFLPLFDTLVLTQSASFWALLVTLASSWPAASASPVTHWITAYNNVHGTHMHNMRRGIFLQDRQSVCILPGHFPCRHVSFLNCVDISPSWLCICCKILILTTLMHT